jgi:hypothetical protein
MMTMMTEKTPTIFICKSCDYSSSKESEYKRHIMTRKHQNNDKNVKKNACVCGKAFMHRQGLHVHRKKCTQYISKDVSNYDFESETKDGNKNQNHILGNEHSISSDDDDDICSDGKITITKEMFIKLLKDNEEMMKMIKSLSENQLITPQQVTNNNNNNITNNNITNNNHFNLNIFLNEKCKDALNMSEFIDSLKITLDDLLFSKTNGITRGVTDIMIKRLKELDIYKRPIHCTDIKRDVMYIKDEDKWHKDNNHDMFKNTIIQVANKERSALQQWANDNPDWMETEQKQIEYLTMVRSICEPIETYSNYERKIVKNIGKEILVDK